VAVENHLIVCEPKDRKVATCEHLMLAAKNEADQRIPRCPHPLPAPYGGGSANNSPQGLANANREHTISTRSTPLGKAAFSVSSRVALQLGRESISSSITAIVELVKNATTLTRPGPHPVRQPRHSGAFMVIEDTGEGMSVDNLRDFWMVIGTATRQTDARPPSSGQSPAKKGLDALGWIDFVRGQRSIHCAWCERGLSPRHTLGPLRKKRTEAGSS